MKITVITIFPEFFASFTSTSIIKRAIESGRVEFETVDFRTFTLDRHRHVDDTPYGGGQGMVLSPQPIADALRSIRQPNSHVVMMTPQGRTFDQQQARRLSAKEHLIFLCGHYEGFDERIRSFADEEISIGDYVLTGGEPAAMVVCDAVIRLQDGVILEQSVQLFFKAVHHLVHHALDAALGGLDVLPFDPLGLHLGVGPQDLKGRG